MVDDILAPEVIAEHIEEEDMDALVKRQETGLEGRGMTIQEIAQVRPQLIQHFTEAMRTAVLQLRRAAFALVDPEDFILNRDKEGNETAMLAGTGCQKIANLIGLSLTNLRGPDGKRVSEPVIESHDDGHRSAVIIGDAKSKVTGLEIEAVRAERSTSEQFIGRSNNVGDLKSATMTLLLSKAVRQMTGMVRVSIVVLKEYGIETDRCRLGHGYGSSQARQAAATGGGDAGKLEAAAKSLWTDMLRVGGDVAGAKTLLRESSKFTKDGKEFSTDDPLRLIARGHDRWLNSTKGRFEKMHPEAPPEGGE